MAIERLMDFDAYENPIPEDERDPNLIARFYKHKVKRFKPEVDKNGKREFSHYEDVDYVEIMAKGMPKSSASHKVTEHHKKKFSREWRHYKENSPDSVDGTPINHLPFIGPSDADNFRAMGIRTAEDLAELQEGALANIRNGREMKAKAKAWLDYIEKAKAEYAPKDTPIEEPETTIVEPKKRGRPAKK